MRIAYIVEPRKIIGGGVRAAMNLAKSLNRESNIRCVIFGTYKNSVVDEQIKFVQVNTLNPIGVAYWRAFHKFVKNQNPDIVHCLGLYTALGCLLYRKFKRRHFKIVCTVHRVTMNMRYRTLMKRVVGYIAKNVDYTTFLTNYQQEHYFSNVGFCPKRYEIIPNVIFVSYVSEHERVNLHKNLCDELNVETIISYVGRIIPSKNLEDFIRIIGILHKRGLRVGGLLVGGYEQSYFERLEKVVKEYGIDNKIKFLGYTNTPNLFTAASDYTTTTTTHGEALPNLLVESFALGKITFSSDIPQMQGLISNGQNGFTLSLSSLEKFADKIEYIINHPDERAKIEQNAQTTYQEEYAPDVVTKKYLDIYSSLK